MIYKLINNLIINIFIYINFYYSLLIKQILIILYFKKIIFNDQIIKISSKLAFFYII